MSAFVVLAVAEALWPRRAVAARAQRWSTNIGLVVFNTAILRLLFLIVPALTVLAAVYVEGRGWGLLPALGLTGLAAAVSAFVLLDLAVYAQHVAFHFVPAFWRLHRVHHADTEFDVTTGVRFHIGEILLSQAWKMAVVLALGAPAAAVLVFEIALNATSMFSHSNLRLAAGFDHLLRLATVTPEMHRVHHSVVMAEMNSNFGFNLSFWDRIFGTYRAASAGDQAVMPIGLASYRGVEPTRFLWSLALPFAGGAAGMKTVYLLRHAKSDWGDPALKDFDRPLNERGREAAPKMGAYLKSKRYKPDAIYCSTARRTVETCELIKDAVGANVAYEEALYLAELRLLIERLKRLEDGLGSAILIGHNPGMEQLANTLVRAPANGTEEKLHRRMREKFSTCALAVIRLPVKTWREIKPGIGTLIDFMRPRDL